MNLFSRKQAELAKEKRNVNELRNQLRKEEIKNSKIEAILNNNKGDNEIKVDCSKLKEIKKYNSHAFITFSIMIFGLFCYDLFINSNIHYLAAKNYVKTAIFFALLLLLLCAYRFFIKKLCNQLLDLNNNFKNESRKKKYTKEVIDLGSDFYLIIYKLIVYWFIIIIMSWGYWATGTKQFLIIINSIISIVGLLEIINTSFSSFARVYNLANEYFGLDSLKILKPFS